MSSNIAIIDQDKTERIRELEQKIFQVTNDCDDLDVVFNALQSTITFWMSTVCPECRKNIARTFKRKIPDMLADANRAAALRAQHPSHQCH